MNCLNKRLSFTEGYLIFFFLLIDSNQNCFEWKTKIESVPFNSFLEEMG